MPRGKLPRLAGNAAELADGESVPLAGDVQVIAAVDDERLAHLAELAAQHNGAPSVGAGGAAAGPPGVRLVQYNPASLSAGAA